MRYLFFSCLLLAIGICGIAQTVPNASLNTTRQQLSDSMRRINTYSIDTITALRTVPRYNGSFANVSGFHAAADGGGGSFYWNDTSTADANGGTIIAPPGARKGRWFRVYGEAVNVKWFGAKGDGRTDDAAAIQAAINTQLNVYVPPGVYYIGSTISLYQREFKGAGSANTIFKVGPGIDAFLLKQNPHAGRLNTEISGFGVSTTTANKDNYCFRAQQYDANSPSVGLKISHIEITGRFGCAFAFYDMFRLDMSNVGISFCWNGIAILGKVVQSSFYGVTANDDIPDSDPKSSLFGGVMHGVIMDNDTYNGATSRPESVKMVACSFVNFDIGIKANQVYFCALDQMDIDLCRNIGVEIYGAEGGFFLTNSWINLNASHNKPASAGVYISTATLSRRPITISNNNISLTNPESITNTYCGIQVGSEPKNYYKRAVNLTGNNIMSPFTYGIYANRTRELKCQGNVIEGCKTAEIYGIYLENSVVNGNTADRINITSNESNIDALNNTGAVSFDGTSAAFYENKDSLTLRGKTFKMGVRTFSGAKATVLPNYPFQVYNGTGSGTATLPSAAGQSGVQITIKSQAASGTLTLNAAGGSQVFTSSGATASIGIGPGKSYTFFSDGTYWNVIGAY